MRFLFGASKEGSFTVHEVSGWSKRMLRMMLYDMNFVILRIGKIPTGQSIGEHFG